MKEEAEVDLFFQKNRFKSFKSSWPFSNSSNLSKVKMAAAGFHFTGNRKEPDLVQCFVCFKELDGWEEDDDPWVEHSRSKDCPFIQLNKSENEMTALDLYDLVMKRIKNKMVTQIDKRIKKFVEATEVYEEMLQNV